MKPETELQIYDIKPIPEVAFMPSNFIWLLVIFIALLSIALFLLIYSRRRSQKNTKINPKTSKKILLKLINTKEEHQQAEQLYALLNNLERLRPKVLIANPVLEKALFALREQRFQSQFNLKSVNFEQVIALLNSTLSNSKLLDKKND